MIVFVLRRGFDLGGHLWFIVQWQWVVIEIDEAQFIGSWARVSLLELFERVQDEGADLQACAWAALTAYYDSDLIWSDLQSRVQRFGELIVIKRGVNGV